MRVTTEDRWGIRWGPDLPMERETYSWRWDWSYKIFGQCVTVIIHSLKSMSAFQLRSVITAVAELLLMVLIA